MHSGNHNFLIDSLSVGLKVQRCFFSFSDFDEMHLKESEAPVSDYTQKTDVEEKTANQRPRLSGANKRMFNLLKKAKVQLIKIDQQKQLKSSGVSP